MMNLKTITISIFAALILGIGGLLVPVNSAEAGNYNRGYQGNYNGGEHGYSGRSRSYYPGPNRQHNYGSGRTGYGYSYQDDQSAQKYRQGYKGHGYKGNGKNSHGSRNGRSFRNGGRSYHNSYNSHDDKSSHAYPLLYGLKALLHHGHY